MCLRDALEQGQTGVFIGLSKILLDAPIAEGGIHSEVIEQIHNEYLNKTPVHYRSEDESLSDVVIQAENNKIKKS